MESSKCSMMVHSSATLLLLVGSQVFVLCAILVGQVYVLTGSWRALYHTPWLSVLCGGILYSLHHGFLLLNLLQSISTGCQDIYIPSLVGCAWILTFVVLDKRFGVKSLNCVLTVFMVGLATLLLAREYHHSTESNDNVEKYPLFCQKSRDLSHIFAQEYLALYLPVVVIGLIQRTYSNKDPKACRCNVCNHWQKMEARLLRWYACVLLLVRPMMLYYSVTSDYYHSDIFLYCVNFSSFLYVFLKTRKVLNKQWNQNELRLEKVIRFSV